MKNSFAVLISFVLISCGGPMTPKLSTQAEQATSATYTPVSFNQIQDWTQDQQQETLAALKRSCALFLKRAPETPVAPQAIGGTIRDWTQPCTDVAAFQGDAAQARAVIEKNFTPYKINTPYGDKGLFTGYYETMLNGSRTKTAQYNVPLYKRPADLVMVELGDFRPGLKGERIAGKIVGGNLKPYADRKQIDDGALQNQNLEIVYVDDADTAFFLHIQGSGRVHLTDGSEIRVGYDGQNGHVYNAIGKELISRGELTPETTNLDSIRAWLKNHPDQAPALRQLNPSYIFFKELDGEGPLGAQGIALTPTRSMAVDPRFIPYGAPIWLDIPHPTQQGVMIRRLMVAQDTGGAIRGSVRGDFFWGAGKQAETNAGHMKSRGMMWILLPKNLQGARSVTLPPLK